MSRDLIGQYCYKRVTFIYSYCGRIRSIAHKNKNNKFGSLYEYKTTLIGSFVSTIHIFTQVTLLCRINRGVANTPDVIAGGDHYLHSTQRQSSHVASALRVRH